MSSRLRRTAACERPLSAQPDARLARHIDTHTHGMAHWARGRTTPPHTTTASPLPERTRVRQWMYVMGCDDGDRRKEKGGVGKNPVAECHILHCSSQTIVSEQCYLSTCLGQGSNLPRNAAGLRSSLGYRTWYTMRTTRVNLNLQSSITY